MEAGETPLPFKFALIPTHTPEMLLEHVRSAVSRNLPDVRECKAHDGLLSVAGGGPSIEDTWKELTGHVAAVNGSLAWLLDKGMVPQMCGICDPSAPIVDMITAHEDVTYFLASCVNPKVFNKLSKCRVYLWHLHPIDGQDALLDSLYPDKGWTQISGGCTMGTRWINLGYHSGFRKFHMHGLDSSFRGKSSHAYPNHHDDKEWMVFDGYPTRINFIGQVCSFLSLMDRFKQPDIDPVEIKMFGEGLLQARFRAWQADNPGVHDGAPKC